MGLTEYSISIGSQIHFNHYSAEERCKTPQSTPLSQVFKLWSTGPISSRRKRL
jgi:hypothetical protein